MQVVEPRAEELPERLRPAALMKTRGVEQVGFVTIDASALLDPENEALDLQLDLLGAPPRVASVKRSPAATPGLESWGPVDKADVFVVAAVERASKAGDPDLVAANVRTRDGDFRIRPAGARGLHVVTKVDYSKYPRCATGEAEVVDVEPGTRKKGVPQQDGSTFDVLILYTEAAEVASYGIRLEAELAIRETNWGLYASGIPSRLRLAGLRRVKGKETDYTGNRFEKMLEALRKKGDGRLEEAHVHRGAADMVSLWISDPEGAACGIGYIMKTPGEDFEDSAFSVVDQACATGLYTFGHELGHNMGCCHDVGHDCTGAYPYSHGYRFIVDGTGYRTIMAYGGETRLPCFSDPGIPYHDAPTGAVGTSENARTVRENRLIVANWR